MNLQRLQRVDMEVCVHKSRRFDERGVHSWIRTPSQNPVQRRSYCVTWGVGLKHLYDL